MTQKCRKIEVGMNRSQVDSILDFPRRVERLSDGSLVEQFGFGGVEKDGGTMKIVYGTDGRVLERKLDRW